MWHQVKCDLWTPGDGYLHVKYWVNGQYLGEFLTPEEPWMQTAGYLDIAAQEGTVWFDDVCINTTGSIPTLSEWGAIIFGTLLLASVAFYIWRRRRVAVA